MLWKEYVWAVERRSGGGVISNRHQFPGGGGGIDGPEADDDRSASPLMCTYLPIGELCHRGDLCTPRLPSPPRALALTPHCIPPQVRPRYLRFPCSPVRRKKAGFTFGKNLNVSSPRGGIYRVFMNDPVYYTPASVCFNIVTAAVKLGRSPFYPPHPFLLISGLIKVIVVLLLQ